jgi:glucokinase
MILAGDIGGTKVNLALFTFQGGVSSPVKEATFASASYTSLEAMAAEFLADVDTPVRRAAFGVAGPVVEGHARITNLPWEVTEDNMRAALGIESVKLLNDLEAIAMAVPVLETTDLHTLNEGQPVHHASLAVIAPGTGLGEAFLTWDGSRYRAHASEGGHASFAPLNAEQIGLLRYLLDKYEHVSFERVCSGIGIPNIYDYLRDSGTTPELPRIEEQLASATDRTPVIVQGALDDTEPSPLCRAALDMFLDILAAESSNLVLKVMGRGGLYLGGGILPRIIDAVDAQQFMRIFAHKGRFSEFMARIPVHIILNPRVALLGAARHGLL